MKKWMIVSLVVAAAGIAVLYFVTAPTDEDLIKAAIAESTQASREGRPGGVIEYLSPSLAINQSPMFDRSEIAKVVRLSRPEVEFGPFTPQVDGDTAVVKADVSVKMQFQTINLDTTFQNVEVKLRRETGVRWLVLPGKKWRITEVTAPDLDQFTGGPP